MTGSRESQAFSQPTGSPPHDEPVFLVVGRLRRSHGLHGEMLLTVITDFPERLASGDTLFLGDARQLVVTKSVRHHHDGLLLAFDGFDTPEAVAGFRNQFLYVLAGDRPPLPEGDYYHHDLIGLQVMTDTGIELGRLASILETGANDVFLVRSASGKELLLPAIPSVLQQIDLPARRITVHLLPGLIDE
jgi:16S rRNA processing protein RimM